MTENIQEKEIHLKDYLRVLKKRRGTIITFFILTFVTVVIATYTATPMFRSGTKVMIEKNTSSDLNSAYRYTPYDPEFLETQYQLIKSAAVVEKVVNNLGPEKFYDLIFKPDEKPSLIAIAKAWVNDRVVDIKDVLGIDRLLSSEDEEVSGESGIETVPLTKAEQLEEVIKNGITAEPVSNSRVVQISFMADNPAVAAKIVNSVAQAYIEELVGMQMEASGYSIGWMKKKADLQRKSLEESERILHAYKKEHDIITIEDRLTVLPERLSDLSRKMTQAETERKELESVYSQVKNISRDNLETIPAIVENTSVDSINRAILAAEQKISELSKQYGSKHPRMMTAKNELADLKKKKYTELNKAVQTIKNKYQLAISNEKSFKELLDQSKFQTSQLGEKSIQLEILKRKVETNRFLYDALIKKIKEEGITEQSQSVNVWVIEKARVPEFPATPNKKRNILLGLILGLFGGIGLAFFLEYLDTTIKTPEDIEEKFNIPVIATVDLFKNKDKTIVEHVFDDPSSMVSENFKSMRTSILLSSPDHPPKTILVTSMTSGEGKSSVCACLASAIAQTGKKVLVIDGDMRRPTQHKIFGLDNSAGLSSLLAGMDVSGDALINRKVDATGLIDIITSGPIPPNPSELLSSTMAGTLINKAAGSYDFIIVDTPPLASVTDPLITSRHVDGVIIVTWAGKTNYELMGKGIRQFKDISAPIMGVVLNRFSAKKSGYYYNYGDYYYASES